MRWRAGIDIGETFTDFALYDEREARLITGKRLTSPRDPSQSALAGLLELLVEAGATPADVGQVLNRGPAGVTSPADRVLDHDPPDLPVRGKPPLGGYSRSG